MLAKFFWEWGLLLASPWKAIKGIADVYKVLAAFVPTALSALAAYWGVVPGWVVPLTALVASYFSLTAGLAFERALVPAVQVGPITADVYSKLFFVLITNGDIPARVRGKVTRVVHSSGFFCAYSVPGKGTGGVDPLNSMAN